jgi:hypothetical protein
MTLEIPVTNAVDEGIYPAVLTKLDLKTIEGGDTFRIWTFDVTADGEVKKITASSSLMLGPKSKAYKWVSALLGRRPEPGEKIEVVGYPCQLHLIVDEDTGYNKVESVLPAGGKVAPRTAAAAPTLGRPPMDDESGLPEMPDDLKEPLPLEEPPDNLKELIP